MTNTLPVWIERALGIEAAPGEGTAWHLDHTWGWPPWVALLFGVFAVVFVVYSYLRENPQSVRWFRMLLASIRLCLVGILLIMLAQLVLSLSKTGLPYAAVLVDDSLSMTVVDRYDEALESKIGERIRGIGAEESSRWNLAKTLLSERNGRMLNAIGRDYKLRLYFLTGARPAGSNDVARLVEEIGQMQPSGETTELGVGIRAVLDDLRGTAPAAIVLLSDGINTDGPGLADAAAYARRKGVPLFNVALGDDRPVRDLKLSDLLVEEVVFVDDVVHFEFKLSGTGFEGQEVLIALREEGRPDVLAEMSATVAADGAARQLRLPYRPAEEGQFNYVVEVEPRDEELQTQNNRQTRTVRVRKEKIRVLLVQAYPNYEFRYLENMLGRDGTIQLNTVLQDADPEHAEQGAASLRGFPVRRDELFGYDVIIMGDVNPDLLNDTMIQNLADFVDKEGRGGALVCIAGPRYMPSAYRDTPLGRLLPVDPDSIRYPDAGEPISEGFVIRPTELGMASPQMQLGDTSDETRIIWADLPPVYWSVEVGKLKPAARVLAEHPLDTNPDGRPLPIIVIHYVGAGKVLFHATDETWRWRFRVGDMFFARYWVQTIRYLARSKLARGERSAVLTTDRREYRRGEPVNLRVRFADERMAPAQDDGVTVVLEHQGHQTRRITLHSSTSGRAVFEGRLNRPAIGSYHAWIAVGAVDGRASAADFTVVAPPGEFERVRMDAVALREAAQLTGGRYYTFSDAGGLLDDLPPGRQVPVESLPPRPLWNRWPLLLLFLVLLISEWVLRKTGQMV